MVHIIPLSVGQRRLDAGNAVQYPQGSPIGGAVQGLGEHLSALAERCQQMKDQQDAFDAEIARRGFDARIAQAEDEVAANAPADGSGLHETMYGQVDLRTGQVAKTGLFDELFDNAKQTMPESQRAAFARRKETMREVGGLRMAQRQLTKRHDYEKAAVDTTLTTNAIAIGKADPDDLITFEAARQQGLDLIDKMGVDPGIRQQMAKDWYSTAAKARFEALIARDPKRALEMFGVGTPATGSEATDDGAQAEGGSMSGAPKMAPGKDDHVGTQTPDERIARAFRDDREAQLDRSPKDALLADLWPDTASDLVRQAHAANAARLIDARADIALAAQNAPDAVANTGVYSGKMPSPETFTAVYGIEEGGKQYGDFATKMDVGRQAFGMRTMSNRAIHAALRDAEPGPGRSTDEQARYEVATAAALKTLSMRREDPAGYVRKVFPDVDAAWNAVTSPPRKSETRDPEAYKWAIAVSVAAQRQLGIETPQPLPRAVAQNLADTFDNEDVPQADKDIILRGLLSAAPDPGTRRTLSQQLDRVGLFWPAEVDPITTAATRQGQPPSANVAESKSAFQQAADDFGNYLSEGFEALGRAPHDIGLALQDLRDSPLGFLEQLPVTPGSGAVAEGRLALAAIGQAVAKGLTIVRGGAGKFAKPLEKLATSGSRATSEVAAERALARQAAEDAAYRLSTGAKPDKAELLKIIKSIARDPSRVKYPGASFGKAASKKLPQDISRRESEFGSRCRGPPRGRAAGINQISWSHRRR